MAQQRIQLRSGLARLYGDLDTFQSKASLDTQSTIERMEKHRTAYRGALLWMKSLSERLDPDSMDQLSKFRRVQAHLRRCKVQFDRLAVDCVQKVDMLGASRCNLLSQSLQAYQSGWMRFWTSSASTFGCIQSGFDCIRKAQQAADSQTALAEKELREPAEAGEPAAKEKPKAETGTDDLMLMLMRENVERTLEMDSVLCKMTDDLLDQMPDGGGAADGGAADDSPAGDVAGPKPGQENRLLMEQLFAGGPDAKGAQLEELLGDVDLLSLEQAPSEESGSTLKSFLPGGLWKLDGVVEPTLARPPEPVDGSAEPRQPKPMEAASKKANTGESKRRAKADEKSDWFNLFAELDPLANPDAIGQKFDQDRNC